MVPAWRHSRNKSKNLLTKLTDYTPSTTRRCRSSQSFRRHASLPHSEMGSSNCSTTRGGTSICGHRVEDWKKALALVNTTKQCAVHTILGTLGTGNGCGVPKRTKH